MGETSKSRERREKEGFYKEYINGKGLDIGCGDDPILPDVDTWDMPQGHAQYLYGIEDETYDYVYSSHCLEHMPNSYFALWHWFRVVKKGGYLLISIPDRELYEKRTLLPSKWNRDHKVYFLLEKHDPPHTIGIMQMIKGALVDEEYELIYARRYGTDTNIDDPDKELEGEFQIEFVIKKL